LGSILLCSAGPARITQDDEIPSGAVLRTKKEQLEFVLFQGEQATRKLRLESVGSEPYPLRALIADHEAVSLALNTGKDIEYLQRETVLTKSYPGGAHVRLLVTVNSKHLDLGDHRVELHVLREGQEDADFSVPLRIRVERESSEEDDRDFDVTKPPVPVDFEGEPGKIVFDHYVHDFQERLAGEPLVHTFSFRNDGAGDLVIQDYRVQCHCSLAKLVLPQGEVKTSHRRRSYLGVLKPGEEGTLDIKIDTAKLAGPIRKQFRLFTNDERGNPTLSVVAQLKQPFKFNETAAFGEVRRTDAASRKITMTSPYLEDFGIEGYNLPSDPVLSLTYKKVPAKLSDVRAFFVDLTVRPDAPYGHHVGTVLLAIDHERVKEARLSYEVKVLPDVDFLHNGKRLHVDSKATDSVNFGVVRPPINMSKTIYIENHDPTVPYVPRVRIDARPTSDPFAVEVTQVEEGNRYQIDLNITGEIAVRYFEGWLVLESDHPNLPAAKIKFKGFYNPRS
jgi:hypothetical protein